MVCVVSGRITGSRAAGNFTGRRRAPSASMITADASRQRKRIASSPGAPNFRSSERNVPDEAIFPSRHAARHSSAENGTERTTSASDGVMMCVVVKSAVGRMVFVSRASAYISVVFPPPPQRETTCFSRSGRPSSSCSTMQPSPLYLISPSAGSSGNAPQAGAA